LLLNAEWNRPKDREVNLHRHPAFFGYVEDVIHDCCGYCPKPITPEDKEIAEEESRTYVFGDISFIKDDPGRQAIGSFNPITDDDWTEMAYIGNTARLCQAIVDGDLEHVQDWLAQPGADLNRRDYTGRTPLHLAVLSSTPEIVRCLVNHGARLVWRLADGRTALHLAASRGDLQMVKILMEKSEANEEEEARKEDLRKQAQAAVRRKAEKEADTRSEESSHEDEGDGEIIADEESDDEDFHSRTTGSFVKVRHEGENSEGDALPDDDNDVPDFYDINAVAWDAPCSPLHLAILNGHTEVVKELVQDFGADVLLPVKLLNEYDRRPRGAILTLVLALTLPLEKAKEMTRTLLELGASSAQADMNHVTALHYFANQGWPELIDTLLEHDLPAVKRAIDRLWVEDLYWNPRAYSPLTLAIECRDVIGALKILDAGASSTIDFDKFMESYQSRYKSPFSRDDSEQNRQKFLKGVEQPVMLALAREEPLIVLELLSRGADPNTLTKTAHSCVLDGRQRGNNEGGSLLDVIREKLNALREFMGEDNEPNPPEPLKEDSYYPRDITPGTYKFWVADRAFKAARCSYQLSLKSYLEEVEKAKKREGLAEKKEAAQGLLHQLEEVEADLLRRGAKTFAELFPKLEVSDPNHRLPYQSPKPAPFEVKFSFKIPDLTDVKRDAYLDLYEAAWDGNLQKIKSLTLALWGPENDRTPLKIAIQDTNGFSPFAIAILRGHLDLAKAILEIAQAQYQPKEQSGRLRYSMGPNGSSDYSECDSEEDEDDGSLHIFSEIVDEQYTIDNIGEVSTQVKSEVAPLALLTWSYRVSEFISDESGSQTKGDPTAVRSLLQYAIWADNVDLLVFLLQLGAEYASRTAEDETTSRIFPVAQGDLDYAIRLGRTRALAELIRRTGAGIPLEDLVKKSGVEVEEKPKYYQGLSVHGQKRKDWSAAVRRRQMRRTGNEHPPSLIAAFQGSIESVEWFLSDTPSRHYNEFAVANQNDERLKSLFKAAGGFDKALSSWLSARSK
jgi:ankyrin repeat protein